jgi:methyl-accepting chemotaxis protein
MAWFKNLKTMTKLMLGFGALALLIGVVGYQGMSGMGKMDEMMSTLYEKELLGVSAIKDVATSVAMIGRQTRNVVITADMGAMQREKDKVEVLFGQVDEAMTRTDQTFHTEKAKALVAPLRQAVPEYRSIIMETIRVAMTNDRAGAVAVLGKAAPVGDRISATVKEASALKEAVGKQAFEDSTRIYEQSRTVMLSIVLIAAGFAIGLGYFIGKLIAAPLRQSVEVLESVAGGDLTRSLDVQTKDEVGQMATALNTAVEGMREALSEVRGSADSLATSSQQLASSSEELASGAQEQAAGLEETSASLQELTASVRQNADSAKQANQLASAARDTAEKGGQVVTSAVAAMSEINTSSKKIADIITAIDEIAFQTNLLALNAAVEAARAGEQGRGFAVVAAEVRSLAQRSATAAKEIKTLIQDSVRKVEAGSQMVNKSGEVLLEIVSSVKRVTDIVGEIAAASREQSAGVDQISKAMAQMDQVTQQNASQTEELSATAQILSSGAEQLQALVTRFRLEDERHARHATPKKLPARKTPGKKAPGGTGAFAHGMQALSRKVASTHEPLGQDASTEPAPVTADRAGGFEEF